MVIVDVTDSNEKQVIARKVLEALTDWFGVEKSREEYISGCANWSFLQQRKKRKPIPARFMRCL